jgi:hypothetical protein
MATPARPLRILVGSPIRQDPRILRHFLGSLERLERDGIVLDFAFVDDNDDAASSELLRDFSVDGQVLVTPGSGQQTAYKRDEQTHFWREELIWKVASYKDWMIGLARQGGYDGLLLLDSDLVLHPLMLRQLVNANVDIVSEVFWTRWTPEEIEMPQVWLSDHYSMVRPLRGQQLTPAEINRRTLEFIDQLRVPGLYEVGGLGACTLISRRAIEAGISFREIPNVSFWGEDRHFCIRAMALGLRLHAETSYPPLHLYRLSEVQRLDDFLGSCDQKTRDIQALETFRQTVEERYTVATGDEISRMFVTRAQVAEVREADTLITAEAVQLGRDGETAYSDRVTVAASLAHDSEGWQVQALDLAPLPRAAVYVPYIRKTRNNRITLSMLVRNEADKYLAEVLSHAATYVDSAVILDDASTDATVEVCYAALRDIPHTVVALPESEFHREWLLRRKQWELTIATRPDWILMLDADEIFEDRMRDQIRQLVDQDQADAIAFRLYDMWDADHYRDDELWRAHRAPTWLRLVRNLPNLSQEWRQTDQHCGQLPLAYHRLPALGSDVRLKHLGWATPSLRQHKYDRYMRLDPDARFGSAEQYRSILDPNPSLVRWAA